MSAKLRLGLIVALLEWFLVVGQAQTVSVLYTFTGSVGYPGGIALTQGLDGNLYGTTGGGTTQDRHGTIFQLTTDGAYQTFHVFQGPTGGYEPEGLILGADGFFYGVTALTTAPKPTGLGTVYKISSAGTFTTIQDLTGTSIAYPGAPPVEAGNLSFYGTAQGGASHAGTVYRLAPDGKVTVAHSFNYTDGYLPTAITLGLDGQLYGTATEGGAGNSGTVFSLSESGQFRLLYSFSGDTDGGGPLGLTLGNDGNLYGMAAYSQPHNFSVLYRITPTGNFSILHTFVGGAKDGSTAIGTLTQASDGRLYGVTDAGGFFNDGTVFSIGIDGSYRLEYVFDYQIGPVNPKDTLIQHTNGLFYGIISTGSSSAVYSLDLGFAPFVKAVLNTGKAGSNVEILGQGFTGTNSVTFNGAAATFSVVSDTYMTATVPNGATSGPIQITTPGAVLISNLNFIVLQ